MTMNLVQHRAEPSIWDNTTRADWDTERWLAALMAGAFFVSGFRRRSLSGLLMVLGGGGLAWWAATAAGNRRARVARLRLALRRNGTEGDMVHESSEESFPASDAPSWTPTTGNTAGPRTTTRAR